MQKPGRDSLRQRRSAGLLRNARADRGCKRLRRTTEEPDLQQSGYSSLLVLHGLWQLATESGAEFPHVKIGAASCEEAYPITYFFGSRDYYGIDIDMTARLQSLAASREVVIDSRLRDKVVADYQRAGNASDFGTVERLVGPENAPPLTGIAGTVVIYRAH